MERYKLLRENITSTQMYCITMKEERKRTLQYYSKSDLPLRPRNLFTRPTSKQASFVGILFTKFVRVHEVPQSILIMPQTKMILNVGSTDSTRVEILVER